MTIHDSAVVSIQNSEEVEPTIRKFDCIRGAIGPQKT